MHVTRKSIKKLRELRSQTRTDSGQVHTGMLSSKFFLLSLIGVGLAMGSGNLFTLLPNADVLLAHGCHLKTCVRVGVNFTIIGDDKIFIYEDEFTKGEPTDGSMFKYEVT